MLISAVQQSDSVIHIYIYSFLKNVFILFIYFWLCWVFIAARGLSLVAASGLLTAVASLAVEHGL